MARQFEVFRTGAGMLVVAVQGNLLDGLRTRVVAPLLPVGAAGRPMVGVNPEVRFADAIYVLAPQLLATLTVAELGPPLGSVAHLREPIERAVGTVLGGAGGV